MIIKLRNNIDRVRTVVYYVDGPMGAAAAREYGIALAREKIDASGSHVWRLALKGEPPVPSDVVALYESIPFGVAVSGS